MYKRHHGILPNMFYSLFTVNRDITGHDTHQSNLLHVPKGVLSVRRKTILFSGVSLHNFLFDRISYYVVILSYKCNLKQYLNPFHSLPNIPYWYIYFTTYLTGLTRFFRSPIYYPWGSLNVQGSLDGYELFYAVLSLSTVHSSLVTVFVYARFTLLYCLDDSAFRSGIWCWRTYMSYRNSDPPTWFPVIQLSIQLRHLSISYFVCNHFV